MIKSALVRLCMELQHISASYIVKGKFDFLLTRTMSCNQEDLKDDITRLTRQPLSQHYHGHAVLQLGCHLALVYQ